MKRGRLKRVIFRGINRLRRFYLLNFRKAYVKKSLTERVGECPPGCGACCGDMKCRYLDKNLRCTIYKERKCLNPFPIDKKEKWLFGVNEKCCYFWPDEKICLRRPKSSRSKPLRMKIIGKYTSAATASSST